MQSLYIFQKGFNFSQDGPGNRLVFHLAGCSLCCPWCSNPEGKTRQGAQLVSVNQLVDEAIRCKPMFFSGGGITLTGGEVTEQFDAVKSLLEQLKAHDISTCIETNGTHPRLPELFPLIDYLIMDCKHYQDDRHREVIGAPLHTILQNIRLAGQQRQQLAVRIPLIGGFNASEADAVGFAQLFQDLGIQNIATIELLRYHEYGKDKYQALGLPYHMTEEARISDNTYALFKEILQSNNIQLITT